MSALGQKQTLAAHQPMSALPPKADLCGANRNVRLGPIADIIRAGVFSLGTKITKSFAITIAAIVGGLCLIAFGLFWGPKKEFIFGGTTMVALAAWFLVETRI